MSNASFSVAISTDAHGRRTFTLSDNTRITDFDGTNWLVFRGSGEPVDAGVDLADLLVQYGAA